MQHLQGICRIWQHALQSGTIITALLVVILEVSHPTSAAVEAAKTVNVLLFYERPESVINFDNAVEYIKKNPSLQITVGEVYKVMSNGSDATKLIQSLCRDIDGAYAQPSEKQPDIVVDFTRNWLASEAVKLLTKVMTLPTISGSFGQQGDVRSWRELTAKQKNYLIHIAPPADMMLQAMRSFVAQQEMTSAGLLVDDDYETYHKAKSLLKGMPTKHLLTRINKREKSKYQLDHLADLDIVNFFIAASLKNISNILGNATFPWLKKENSYFSEEYAWYSMSMEPGLPNCTNCQDNVTLIHLEPKLPNAGTKRRSFLKGKGIKNLMDLFYFDLAMSAISTVAKMKSDGSWSPPPKRQCKEVETGPDDYDLKLFDYLVVPEISKENSIGPFHFDGEKAVGKSFAKFSMTIKRLKYDPKLVDNQPYEVMELGTWETGFGEKELIKSSDDVASEWEDHLVQKTIKIAAVLQPPFVFHSSECQVKNDRSRGRISHYGSPFHCELMGHCVELLNQITQDYNLTYSTKTLSFFNSDLLPRPWESMVNELRYRKAYVNLREVSPIKKNRTKTTYYVDDSTFDLVGISIPVPKETVKVPSIVKILARYGPQVNECLLKRLRYFSFKNA